MLVNPDTRHSSSDSECLDEEVLRHPSPPAANTNISADKQHTAQKQSKYKSNLIYGDPIAIKGEDTLRIGVQNFNGLTGKEGDPVDHSLPTWIEKYEFDVFGISEVNMFWPRVKPELQFIDRVYSWFNPLCT